MVKYCAHYYSTTRGTLSDTTRAPKSTASSLKPPRTCHRDFRCHGPGAAGPRWPACSSRYIELSREYRVRRWIGEGGGESNDNRRKGKSPKKGRESRKETQKQRQGAGSARLVARVGPLATYYTTTYHDLPRPLLPLPPPPLLYHLRLLSTRWRTCPDLPSLLFRKCCSRAPYQAVACPCRRQRKQPVLSLLLHCYLAFLGQQDTRLSHYLPDGLDTTATTTRRLPRPARPPSNPPCLPPEPISFPP
jgi:hypothetical protein